MEKRQFTGLVGRTASKAPKQGLLTVPEIEEFLRDQLHSICADYDTTNPGWSRRWAEWALAKFNKKRASGSQYNADVAKEAASRVRNAATAICDQRFPSQNQAIKAIKLKALFLFGVKISTHTFYKNKQEWIHLVEPSEAHDYLSHHRENSGLTD